MSGSLPFSLSPHVVVLASPDLVGLLKDRKIPPLPDLLRSFAPLESISTRTTGLATVTHDKYFVRFSDLLEVESACKEDEEVRSSRTFDWMGSRVSRRAATWVKEVEERPLNLGKEMKWWEDIRLCAEGDIAPNRAEGWNHPVALILATSTMASNPLQSITALHSRAVDFPPWVDPTMLKFTLIVHPVTSSPLNMDESQALLNAVKKQYGLHSHLMSWSLSGSTTPNPFIPPLPRLPPPPSNTLDTPGQHQLDDLTEDVGGTSSVMGDEDIQTVNRFVREFVTQSLIPWMERNVVEWNEAYVATRRLPSRLFSTTRRLFGTSGPTTPVPSSPSSPAPSTAVQQRRLAEFATFLGDMKLATSVFDTLRKDTSNTSASDVLPLLLAPSKTLENYAINALVGARFVGTDPSPSSQLRALKYAIRWERGIKELNAIGGDHWLVWAAGSSEEAPPSLLIAQSAQMCARKGSLRKATLCYVAAANRLDKCGIKPLTMHFLRLARDLCNAPIQKSLSPAFFESEDNTQCGFEGIAPGIEHALGRLKYTTGDTEGAVNTFITLLHSANAREATKGDDAIYLEDFKLALEHLISTIGPEAASQLKLPIQFCQPQKTEIRVGTLDSDDDAPLWEQLEETWKTFWKPNGPVTLRSSGKAQAEEMFWVELSMHNPLDAEVTLSDLTLTVNAPDGINITIESLAEVVLRPKETRLLHMGLTCQSAGTVVISHITYRFLSLLPVTEALTWRGARLHATAQQRQGKMYAPDHTVVVQILPRGARLDVELAEADSRAMGVGELRNAIMRVEHPIVGGSIEPVTDVWAVMGEAGWPVLPQCLGNSSNNSLNIRNTLGSPSPVQLPIEQLTGSPILALGKHLDLQIAYCGHELGLHDILVLLVFRKENDEIFYTARMRIPFHVEPSLQVAAHVQPSADTAHCAYTLTVEIENAGSRDVQISQLSTTAIAWKQSGANATDTRYDSSADRFAGLRSSTHAYTLSYREITACHFSLPLSVAPTQLGRLLTTLAPVVGGKDPDHLAEAIETRNFTTRQLRNVLDGVHETSTPPPVHVAWTYASPYSSTNTALIRHFAFASRRAHVLGQLRAQLELVPSGRAANLVPLFGAHDLDIVLEYSSQSGRSRGLLFAHGLQLGGLHGGILDEEEGDDVKKKKKGRSMYAETEREREMLAAQIKASTWNASGPCVSIDVSSAGAGAVVQEGKMGTIPVTFTLRNFSLSRMVQCTLDLKHKSDTPLSLSPSHLPASYSGQTMFRRTVPPLETCHINARIAVWRPGVYGLGGWMVRCEVAASDNVSGEWRTGDVYDIVAPEPEQQDVVVVRQA